MKIIDKFCDKIGIGVPPDEPGTKPEDMAPAEEAAPDNVVSIQTAGGTTARGVTAALKMKVVVIEPKSFDDAQQVANCLREKRPVVINFENTDGDDARRIIDFISGTTYALNGEIKKVGHNVFFCAPSNVNVTYTEEERKVSTEMPWLKK